MNLLTPQFVGLMLLLVIAIVIIITCEIQDVGDGCAGEPPCDESDHEKERGMVVDGEGSEVSQEEDPADMKASAVGTGE
jgi:hypothetical protein